MKNQAVLLAVKDNFVARFPIQLRAKEDQAIRMRYDTRASCEVQIVFLKNTASATESFFEDEQLLGFMDDLPGFTNSSIFIRGEHLPLPLWAIKLTFESKKKAKLARVAIMECHHENA